jgi:glycosyltransferase involved in cell wall biosynthesis
MMEKPRIYDPREPLVSVCVFNYNYGRYLRECLDSVLAQTYSNIEICFSDNASTDESWDIALEYQRRHPDVFFVARMRRNFGSDANFRNCAVNIRGKYFVELCSDDALLPDFVRRTVDALERHPDAGLAIVHRAILDEHGQRLEEAPFYDRSCKVPAPAQAAVYIMAGVNPSVTQVLYRTSSTYQRFVVGGLAARWYGTRFLDFQIACQEAVAYLHEPLMLHRLHLANDSFRAAENLMEVVGPYVLSLQFAELADGFGHDEVVARLPAAIAKVGALAVRYSARALLNGDLLGARRYLDLGTAFVPSLRDDPTYRMLDSYWGATTDAEREAVLVTAREQQGLVTRTVSYAPPEGSVPL